MGDNKYTGAIGKGSKSTVGAKGTNAKGSVTINNGKVSKTEDKTDKDKGNGKDGYQGKRRRDG